MDNEVAGAPKTIQLRYAGRCRSCSRELAVGALAVHDRAARKVTCLGCAFGDGSAGEVGAGPIADLPVGSENAVRRDKLADDAEVFAGIAGASAQREYERRKNNREARIRAQHPLVGGLILSMSDDPQSTKAWATGSSGEERLGRRLDKLAGPDLHVLHDRRIRRTRANIDHIVVAASGVYVVDAKKYKGRPRLHVEGGLIRARVEKLMVGSRDCTKLVAGVHKQIEHVQSALESAGFGDIPVAGMLCFVEGDWPLIGGDFSIAGLHVLWPKKAAERLTRPGHIDPSTTQSVHRILASAFPPA